MSRTSLALRLSAYLGAIFLMLGAQLPFWPLYLEGEGLNATDIGVVVAAASWARVFGLPLWGRVADPPGRGRPTLLGLALVGAAVYAAFYLVEGYWPALVLQVLIGFFTGALIPLGDSQILQATREQGVDYGRVRLWGSATFILGNLIGGWLIALENRDWYLAALVLPLLATAAAAWALPRRPRERAARAPVGLRVLLHNRAYLSIGLVSCFLQASHGAYYVISAIAWRAAGYSEAAIAWLWIEGVVAEILLLAAGKHLLRRYATTTLLAIGGIASAVRWSLTAVTNDLALLIVLQALHALSFAIVHLASVTALARVVPPERLASAQSLWTAVYAGLFISASMALAGWFYELQGQVAAYGAMAGFSLAGLVALMLLRRWLAPQPVP
ncbi:MAG TPA: MFS transporter [Kiloniellales bacterium]|nr:MFS transporter [Kiloniellales bacterium]